MKVDLEAREIDALLDLIRVMRDNIGLDDHQDALAAQIARKLEDVSR